MPRTKHAPRHLSDEYPRALALHRSVLPRKSARPPLPTTGIKRARRFRPGIVALREIRRYQKSVDPLIPRRRFQQLVRELSENETWHRDCGFVRWQTTAIAALQEASEAFITQLLSDANTLAIHAHRVTLMKKDLLLALRLRGYRQQCLP